MFESHFYAEILYFPKTIYTQKMPEMRRELREYFWRNFYADDSVAKKQGRLHGYPSRVRGGKSSAEECH